MNKFVKSVLALGITSALSLTAVHAATYEVIDKGAVGLVKYSYAQQENNQGQMAISGTGIYNLPVQFQYLDEDDFDAIVRLAEIQHENVHELVDIEDESALRAGNPTGNDLSWVIRFINSLAGSSLYQKFGDIVTMRNLTGNAGDTEDFAVFDQYFPGTTTLTRSTIEYVNGITNDGWIYGNGSAPYVALPFTESNGDQVTHWVRDFTTRAYFSPDAGETIIELKPPTENDDAPENLRFGGESAIFDISESLFAVGYASTSIDQDALDFISDTSGGCADEDVLDDIPYEVCIQRAVGSMYNTEAIKWTISLEGQTTAITLGHLVTPHVEDEREFVNYAQAINNQGVAVGFAHGWWDENETEPSEFESRQLYAVVYKNGEVKDFTEDHSVFFDSRTYDINDAGIAVGHVKTYVNGNLRTKFYHVDTNEFDSGMTMIRPTDFFTGSSSTARAINENGIIVGEGEVETHNDSSSAPRRKHAFMYDIASKTFTDLNDFLTCTSEYTIIEARDINDNNEISASALIKVPRRDSKGELMLNKETGEQLVEDVVRAVTLRPIAGEVEDCSVVEEKVERQGASFGFAGLFTLLVLGFRRTLLKK
ncbi:MAG: DUF3466 family protein [Colwellia sp.]|nr:DUF3466 family protein [Colwellia sp.]